jgi:DNA-binding beta-propeller fold protein YncE
VRRAAAAALAALALLAAGCGSEEANPPPAEPAASPPLAERPAGKVLRVGAEAEGVAVSRGGIATIAFRDPDRLEMIDMAAVRVVGRVETPNPARHLEMANDRRTVLVPIEYSDVLWMVYVPCEVAADTRGALCALGPGPIRTGDFPHDAVEADGGRIFVADEGGDAISVIEGSRVTDTLEAPEQPGGIATSGGLVAAVAVAAREIAFWDADSLEEVDVLDAGAGPSHVVASDDGRFYVVDTGGDALLVYEGDGGDGEPRLLDRLNLPDSPYGIAIDDRRDELWVTRTGANEVDRIDLGDGAPKVTGTYPTVRQPNSVGVDERSGRVVVVGRDDGAVQVFDPGEEG